MIYIRGLTISAISMIQDPRRDVLGAKISNRQWFRLTSKNGHKKGHHHLGLTTKDLVLEWMINKNFCVITIAAASNWSGSYFGRIYHQIDQFYSRVVLVSLNFFPLGVFDMKFRIINYNICQISYRLWNLYGQVRCKGLFEKPLNRMNSVSIHVVSFFCNSSRNIIFDNWHWHKNQSFG